MLIEMIQTRLKLFFDQERKKNIFIIPFSAELSSKDQEVTHDDQVTIL